MAPTDAWKVWVKVCVVLVLSLGAVVARVGYSLVTPLWLDFFRVTAVPWANTTNATSSGVHNHTLSVLPLDYSHINVTFLLVGHYGFVVLVVSLMWVFTMVVCPQHVSNADYSYPKRRIALIGLGTGLSSVIYNRTLSGTRTAPYL